MPDFIEPKIVVIVVQRLRLGVLAIFRVIVKGKSLNVELPVMPVGKPCELKEIVKGNGTAVGAVLLLTDSTCTPCSRY